MSLLVVLSATENTPIGIVTLHDVLRLQNQLSDEPAPTASFPGMLLSAGGWFVLANFIRTLDDNFVPDADPWNSHLGRGEQRAACLA